MSSKRIGIGARPVADPQAEAWVRQGAGIDHGKVERYSARLTLDVTSALRTRTKLAAFDCGVTISGSAARVAEAAGHVMTPGTHRAWRPLTLLAGSIFILS